MGDLFMSLVHSCELCGANPFDDLTQPPAAAARDGVEDKAGRLDALELVCCRSARKRCFGSA
jgi:hypothetical protein